MQPCCSPTSSARRKRRRGSATGAGANCFPTTTTSFARRSPAGATEVKSIGDGFLATFDGRARAVHCAKEIVAGVEPLGLDVRTGLHPGEGALVGDDVAGMPVHIGARVMAEAKAGEVLASSTVKDLVVGSELRFEDRGSHALKGVPDEWRLYTLAPS